MQAKDLVRRVTELVLPICEEAGVTLWDVEFEKEGAQHMLTVTIDREGGVDIDHCETVSRALDPLLDAREFDSLPAYTLCVSSAGLARKLRKPAHFEAFLGSEIELRFYKPVNGSKSAVGKLAAYDEGRVTVDFGDRQTVFEPGDLADVKLAVKF